MLVFCFCFNQCMNSFHISADGQMDELYSYGYMECQGRGVRLETEGLAALGSLYCSVHATSLCSESAGGMSENEAG